MSIIKDLIRVAAAIVLIMVGSDVAYGQDCFFCGGSPPFPGERCKQGSGFGMTNCYEDYDGCHLYGDPCGIIPKLVPEVEESFTLADGRAVLLAKDGSYWLQASAGQWVLVRETSAMLFARVACDGTFTETARAVQRHPLSQTASRNTDL